MRHPQWFVDFWNWMDWKWFWTSLVALYGAVLSTWREILARREKVPSVVVRLYTRMVVGGLPEGSKDAIQVRVENHGSLPLTFESNCCSLATDKEGAPLLLFWDTPFVSVKFPHTLAPGTSFTLTQYRDELARTLAEGRFEGATRVRVIVTDPIGRQFKSDWVRLPLGSEH